MSIVICSPCDYFGIMFTMPWSTVDIDRKNFIEITNSEIKNIIDMKRKNYLLVKSGLHPNRINIGFGNTLPETNNYYTKYTKETYDDAKCK